MPIPFRSTIFSGGSFAASGSNGHQSAGLLIYSASRSTSGLLPSADLAKIGSDVFLYVSGVVGSRGTSTAGTILIGGDLVISGTAYDGNGNVIGTGGGVSSPNYFTSPQAGTINTTGSISIQGSLTVSGSTIHGDSLSDTHVFTGSLFAPSISGSITRLPGGLSYLVAGPNVTIVSGSNGQVTISAASGSGLPGGSSTHVQFNDSGVFNGTGGLTFDKTTGNLQVTGSLFASSSGGVIVLDGSQPTVTVRASSDTSNQGVFYQEIGGDTYVSNQKNSGKFFSSVKTSAGVAVRYLRAIPNAVNYNTIVSFVQGLHDFFDPQTNTTDVNFYVGGKVGSKGSSGQRGTALFAGDMVVSGSTHMQNGGSITGSFSIQGSIIPSADSTYSLGTNSLRWGHVYTGDLHLRNERGDWTILEEPDFLCVINNRTGKKYRMMLQPIE